MAVQYAKAMGLNVIAVDVDDASSISPGAWAQSSPSTPAVRIPSPS